MKRIEMNLDSKNIFRITVAALAGLGAWLITSDNEKCPPATKDIELNTKNRDRAIQKFDYGPPNPAMPSESFWVKLASRWNKNPSPDQIKEAKSMRCGNCGVFDVSPSMKLCMPRTYRPDAYEEAAMKGGAVLGFCWAHNFKCASTRTCATWVQGPAITQNERSPLSR
jgi:hypothetical protein